MTYNFHKQLTIGFDDAITKVTQSLKEQGFGIITEIDLQEKFKEKLDIDFRKYKILGACNPAAAHKAIQIEDKIGVMLPCNIVVQEKENGTVDVAAVNPLSSIGAVNNDNMQAIADEISQKLQAVINDLN
jgi:uncharacterized protein (DUF302 family)